jgi:EAL domain-containing protein (putative c-di-GMP-specific phosphodiesterase class I)
VSTSSLAHPDLLGMVGAVVEESGIDPSCLTLEITETTLMSDPERVLQVTRDIASRGIGIAIDDYGTGYSSLAYLNDLPAGELKLDRAFTARLAVDQRTASIVAGTIDLAHGLGLRVVAEGVEDEATLEVLRKFHCDETQGFLHARPMSGGHFLVWLGNHAQAAAPPPAPSRGRAQPALGSGG